MDTVRRVVEDGQARFVPRELNDLLRDDTSEPAFLLIDPGEPWPSTLEEAIASGRIPEEWVEEMASGRRRVRRSRAALCRALGALGLARKKRLGFHPTNAGVRLPPLQW